MQDLFYIVLNMSITAIYVILGVMLVRQFLKRSPKIVSYILWSVVAVRLVIPFSMESVFSLLPKNINTTPIPNDIALQEVPRISSGLNVVDTVVNNSLPTATNIYTNSVNPMQIYEFVAMSIWIFGMLVFFTYYIYSILRLKKQLKNSELVTENIYEAKNLKTPFVMGVFNPKIYLPKDLSLEERKYIILHEQIHIKRKDYLVKTIGFIILSVHWFNPLVWISFVLMNKDMEYSCDERVLKEIDANIKKSYAMSLVNLASDKQLLNRIAFGEGDVKGRVKNVLNYKKRSLWIVVFSVAIAIALGVGLLSNPVSGSEVEINEVDTNVEDTNIEDTTNIDTLEPETVKEEVLNNNYVYFDESGVGNGLFYLGMSSDEVFELVSKVDLDMYFNVNEEGTYDDKMLRLMDELPENSEVKYEYVISEGMHLYFDKDKKLVSLLVQLIESVNTYSLVKEYFQENQENIFYSGALNTEKGINLLSTKDDLIELYGEPMKIVQKVTGDVYIYKVDSDLYLLVTIIGSKEDTEFIHRISYSNTAPIIFE